MLTGGPVLVGGRKVVKAETGGGGKGKGLSHVPLPPFWPVPPRLPPFGTDVIGGGGGGRGLSHIGRDCRIEERI